MPRPAPVPEPAFRAARRAADRAAPVRPRSGDRRAARHHGVRRLVNGVLVALLAVVAACGDAPAADSNGASPLTLPPRVPVYTYEIVREYPHDPRAFTQGLQWVDDRLVEGTGQVGESSLRRVRLETGEVVQRRDLPSPYFGEGITVLGDTLYQLTWTDGIAFLYDATTFDSLGSVRYEGEGRGLTTDGSRLIMSDGTARLRFRDPVTFAEVGSVTVTENGRPMPNLNELEWVNGEVWANVWTSERIARIDPASGAVVGWIDLAGLLPQMDRKGTEDVLNGIAYDAAGDRIFVTGKYWSRLYEIRIKPR